VKTVSNIPRTEVMVIKPRLRTRVEHISLTLRSLTRRVGIRRTHVTAAAAADAADAERRYVTAGSVLHSMRDSCSIRRNTFCYFPCRVT